MSWRFVATATQGLTATGFVAVSKPISVSLWFNPASNPTTVYNLLTMNASTASNNALSLQIATAATLRIADTTSTGSRTANTTYSAIQGTWNHAFALFTASNDRRVALNGLNLATNSTNCPAAAPTRLAIGTTADVAPAGNFDGMIGEVAIWNTQLSGFEGIWLAKGNSPLNLWHRQNNLVYYRSLAEGNPNEELDEFAKANTTPLRQTGDPGIGPPNAWVKKPRTSESIVDAAMALLLAAAGAVTTNITLAATAVGVSTLVKQVGKITSVIASGVTAFVRGVATNLATTTVGITSDVLSVGKLLATSAVGIPTITALKVFNVVLAVIAVGVVTITKSVGKITSATATGVSAFVRGVSTNLTVTTVGITGNVLSVGKNLGATAVGVAALISTFAISITLAAVAVGVSAVAKQVNKLLAAIGIGVPTVTADHQETGEIRRKFFGGGSGIGMYGLSSPKKRFARRRRK